MKLVSLEDLFEAFLEAPSCDGFLRVREQLIADDQFAPLASAIDDLAHLVDHEQAAAALHAADELMPTWGLCPRVHFLAGLAAEMLGDADEVELRRFLVSSCLDGILLSGRGTRRSPYLATYPSDMQDVLAAKRLTAKSQRSIDSRLSNGADTRLAGVLTHQGATVWFDVGAMFSAEPVAQPIARRRRAATRG